MTKVVVTGGAGFIGSHLCKSLLESGFEVVVIDDLSGGSLENLDGLLPRLKLLKMSILDSNINNAIRDSEYVFHQAAISNIPQSLRNPVRVAEVNIQGTLNLLRACRKFDPEKFIYASSAAVYGDPSELPLSENSPTNPKSFYGVSKLIGEHYCRIFQEIYGIKTVCLRYFNVYGPHQNPRSRYAAAIPRFILRILQGKPPIIYGDGTQTRDFVFVEDVVRANLLAMNPAISGVFNIATGIQTSINQLAAMIAQCMGIQIQPIYARARSFDVQHSLADISKSKQILGYRPKYSLRDGLKLTIAWYQRQGSCA